MFPTTTRNNEQEDKSEQQLWCSASIKAVTAPLYRLKAVEGIEDTLAVGGGFGDVRATAAAGTTPPLGYSIGEQQTAVLRSRQVGGMASPKGVVMAHSVDNNFISLDSSSQRKSGGANLYITSPVCVQALCSTDHTLH